MALGSRKPLRWQTLISIRSFVPPIGDGFVYTPRTSFRCRRQRHMYQWSPFAEIVGQSKRFNCGDWVLRAILSGKLKWFPE